MTNIQSNIKLVISGGQNEPRDAIAGTAAALLTNPNALDEVLLSGDWGQAFLEYARWMSLIGMSPRRISEDGEVLGYDFKKNDRVFLMFGAANRDPAFFVAPEIFDVSRNTGSAISFRAGPHFCAGAAASRALIFEVTLPQLCKAFPNLELTDEVKWGGWAFRGPLAVKVLTNSPGRLNTPMEQPPNQK